VHFFMQTLDTLHIDKAILSTKKIGVVGPVTAKAIEAYGLQAHFIPTKFTTQKLAKELQDVKDKKVLLPRAALATPLLVELLQKKGAIVTMIPLYNTILSKSPNKKFIQLVEQNGIAYLTFTSPSTIAGFLNGQSESIRKKVLDLPVIAIGPVTAKAAKENGFKDIITANPHTVEGLIAKIKENIL
jgi:uroporphyrinogen-III synthase